MEIDINVSESMGANSVNTICEHLTEIIENITQGRVSLKILTNLCTKRRSISSFSIPIEKMAYKNFPVNFRTFFLFLLGERSS